MLTYIFHDYTVCAFLAGWEDINVRFLCGADLLESFSVPNLWKEEDVWIYKSCSAFKTSFMCRLMK